ncbi:hypothetical protein RVR_4434 [Actinacidiphila reveromycinica]|uniref:DUF3307 domain-containing protein n=1 Tax=Actinacidiphila reveromycinica TaxID=659352 RepID=A0A7U3UTC5_9ACTN|nr:hypothetical protein [Streptomyces sp. SN-593]BBA98301.1 hypothetical protein RVR_4434 [Streptomyces sp. SN-593]
MNTHHQPAAVQAAVAYAALTAAHEVGDYIVQRDADAKAKGKHGPAGAAACARHVASYTATQGLALYAADRYLRLGLDWRRAGAALLVSAVTHYVADRCAGHWPDDSKDAPLLVRAAHAAGKTKWLQGDPAAGPLIDQAWHKGCIAVAAAVAAGRRTRT